MQLCLYLGKELLFIILLLLLFIMFLRVMYLQSLFPQCDLNISKMFECMSSFKFRLHAPRRKRSHPDEGWVECPALGEGWKRKEVVRRSGSSIGQKDVYYLR